MKRHTLWTVAIWLLGCLLPALLLLLWLLDSPAAVGLDGYYYALQIKSLRQGLALLYEDQSWVYQFMAGLDWLVNEPGLTPRLAASLASLISLTGVLLLWLNSPKAIPPADNPKLSERFRHWLTPLASLVLLGLSPLWIFLHLEYIKNALGLSCLVICVVALRQAMVLPKPTRLARPWFWGLLALGSGLLCLTAHRLTALCLLFWLTGRFGLPLIWRSWQRRRWLALSILAGILVVIGLVAAYLLIARNWRERLSGLEFSILAPLQRLNRLRSFSSAPTEYVALLLIQLGIPLYGILYYGSLASQAIKKSPLRRLPSPIVSGQLAVNRLDTHLFLWLALAGSFPFFPLHTDGASWRFFLLTPLCLALHVVSRPTGNNSAPLAGDAACASKPWRQLGLAGHWGLTATLVLGGLLALANYPSVRRYWHVRRYPQYSALIQEFAGLEQAAQGRIIISPHGVSCLLMYEFALQAESFTPAEPSPEHWRLVYKLRPELFEPYRQGDEPLPDWHSSDFCLIPETIWQRFSKANAGSRLLEISQPPQQYRPASAAGLNLDTARPLASNSYPADSLETYP